MSKLTMKSRSQQIQRKEEKCPLLSKKPFMETKPKEARAGLHKNALCSKCHTKKGNYQKGHQQSSSHCTSCQWKMASVNPKIFHAQFNSCQFSDQTNDPLTGVIDCGNSARGWSPVFCTKCLHWGHVPSDQLCTELCNETWERCSELSTDCSNKHPSNAWNSWEQLLASHTQSLWTNEYKSIIERTTMDGRFVTDKHCNMKPNEIESSITQTDTKVQFPSCESQYLESRQNKYVADEQSHIKPKSKHFIELRSSDKSQEMVSKNDVADLHRSMKSQWKKDSSLSSRPDYLSATFVHINITVMPCTLTSEKNASKSASDTKSRVSVAQPTLGENRDDPTSGQSDMNLALSSDTSSKSSESQNRTEVRTVAMPSLTLNPTDQPARVGSRDRPYSLSVSGFEAGRSSVTVESQSQALPVSDGKRQPINPDNVEHGQVSAQKSVLGDTSRPNLLKAVSNRSQKPRLQEEGPFVTRSEHNLYLSNLPPNPNEIRKLSYDSQHKPQPTLPALKSEQNLTNKTDQRLSRSLDSKTKKGDSGKLIQKPQAPDDLSEKNIFAVFNSCAETTPGHSAIENEEDSGFSELANKYISTEKRSSLFPSVSNYSLACSHSSSGSTCSETQTGRNSVSSLKLQSRAYDTVRSSKRRSVAGLHDYESNMSCHKRCVVMNKRLCSKSVDDKGMDGENFLSKSQPSSYEGCFKSGEQVLKTEQNLRLSHISSSENQVDTFHDSIKTKQRIGQEDGSCIDGMEDVLHYWQKFPRHQRESKTTETSCESELGNGGSLWTQHFVKDLLEGFSDSDSTNSCRDPSDLQASIDCVRLGSLSYSAENAPKLEWGGDSFPVLSESQLVDQACLLESESPWLIHSCPSAAPKLPLPSYSPVSDSLIDSPDLRHLPLPGFRALFHSREDSLSSKLAASDFPENCPESPIIKFTTSSVPYSKLKYNTEDNSQAFDPKFHLISGTHYHQNTEADPIHQSSQKDLSFSFGKDTMLSTMQDIVTHVDGDRIQTNFEDTISLLGLAHERPFGQNDPDMSDSVSTFGGSKPGTSLQLQQILKDLEDSESSHSLDSVKSNNKSQSLGQNHKERNIDNSNKLKSTASPINTEKQSEFLRNHTLQKSLCSLKVQSNVFEQLTNDTSAIPFSQAQNFRTLDVMNTDRSSNSSSLPGSKELNRSTTEKIAPHKLPSKLHQWSTSFISDSKPKKETMEQRGSASSKKSRCKTKVYNKCKSCSIILYDIGKYVKSSTVNIQNLKIPRHIFENKKKRNNRKRKRSVENMKTTSAPRTKGRLERMDRYQTATKLTLSHPTPNDNNNAEPSLMLGTESYNTVAAAIGIRGTSRRLGRILEVQRRLLENAERLKSQSPSSKAMVSSSPSIVHTPCHGSDKVQKTSPLKFITSSQHSPQTNGHETEEGTFSETLDMASHFSQGTEGVVRCLTHAFSAGTCDQQPKDVNRDQSEMEWLKINRDNGERHKSKKENSSGLSHTTDSSTKKMKHKKSKREKESHKASSDKIHRTSGDEEKPKSSKDNDGSQYHVEISSNVIVMQSPHGESQTCSPGAIKPKAKKERSKHTRKHKRKSSKDRHERKEKHTREKDTRSDKKERVKKSGSAHHSFKKLDSPSFSFKETDGASTSLESNKKSVSSPQDSKQNISPDMMSFKENDRLSGHKRGEKKPGDLHQKSRKSVSPHISSSNESLKSFKIPRLASHTQLSETDNSMRDQEVCSEKPVGSANRGFSSDSRYAHGTSEIPRIDDINRSSQLKQSDTDKLKVSEIQNPKPKRQLSSSKLSSDLPDPENNATQANTGKNSPQVKQDRSQREPIFFRELKDSNQEHSDDVRVVKHQEGHVSPVQERMVKKISALDPRKITSSWASESENSSPQKREQTKALQSLMHPKKECLPSNMHHNVSSEVKEHGDAAFENTLTMGILYNRLGPETKADRNPISLSASATYKQSVLNVSPPRKIITNRNFESVTSLNPPIQAYVFQEGLGLEHQFQPQESKDAYEILRSSSEGKCIIPLSVRSDSHIYRNRSPHERASPKRKIDPRFSRSTEKIAFIRSDLKEKEHDIEMAYCKERDMGIASSQPQRKRDRHGWKEGDMGGGASKNNDKDKVRKKSKKRDSSSPASHMPSESVPREGSRERDSRRGSGRASGGRDEYECLSRPSSKEKEDLMSKGVSKKERGCNDLREVLESRRESRKKMSTSSAKHGGVTSKGTVDRDEQPSITSRLGARADSPNSQLTHPYRGRDAVQVAEERKGRRAHPYSRPLAKEKKEDASNEFDLAYRNLAELMQCLSASSFKSSSKQRQKHNHKNFVKPGKRFASYRFERSEVSCQDEMAQEELLRQEDIQDFEKRKQMADIMEELGFQEAEVQLTQVYGDMAYSFEDENQGESLFNSITPFSGPQLPAKGSSSQGSQLSLEGSASHASETNKSTSSFSHVLSDFSPSLSNQSEPSNEYVTEVLDVTGQPDELGHLDEVTVPSSDVDFSSDEMTLLSFPGSLENKFTVVDKVGFAAPEQENADLGDLERTVVQDKSDKGLNTIQKPNSKAEEILQTRDELSTPRVKIPLRYRDPRCKDDMLMHSTPIQKPPGMSICDRQQKPPTAQSKALTFEIEGNEIVDEDKFSHLSRASNDGECWNTLSSHSPCDTSPIRMERCSDSFSNLSNPVQEEALSNISNTNNLFVLTERSDPCQTASSEKLSPSQWKQSEMLLLSKTPQQPDDTEVKSTRHSDLYVKGPHTPPGEPPNDSVLGTSSSKSEIFTKTSMSANIKKDCSPKQAIVRSKISLFRQEMTCQFRLDPPALQKAPASSHSDLSQYKPFGSKDTHCFPTEGAQILKEGAQMLKPSHNSTPGGGIPLTASHSDTDSHIFLVTSPEKERFLVRGQGLDDSNRSFHINPTASFLPHVGLYSQDMSNCDEPTSRAGVKTQADLIQDLMDAVNSISAQVQAEAPTQHPFIPTALSGDNVKLHNCTFSTASSQSTQSALQSNIPCKNEIVSKLHQSANVQQRVPKVMAVVTPCRPTRDPRTVRPDEVSKITQPPPSSKRDELPQKLSRKHRRPVGPHPLRFDKWDKLPETIEFDQIRTEPVANPALAQRGYKLLALLRSGEKDPRLEPKSKASKPRVRGRGLVGALRMESSLRIVKAIPLEPANVFLDEAFTKSSPVFPKKVSSPDSLSSSSPAATDSDFNRSRALSHSELSTIKSSSDLNDVAKLDSDTTAIFQEKDKSHFQDQPVETNKANISTDDTLHGESVSRKIMAEQPQVLKKTENPSKLNDISKPVQLNYPSSFYESKEHDKGTPSSISTSPENWDIPAKHSKSFPEVSESSQSVCIMNKRTEENALATQGCKAVSGGDKSVKAVSVKTKSFLSGCRKAHSKSFEEAGDANLTGCKKKVDSDQDHQICRKKQGVANFFSGSIDNSDDRTECNKTEESCSSSPKKDKVLRYSRNRSLDLIESLSEELYRDILEMEAVLESMDDIGEPSANGRSGNCGSRSSTSPDGLGYDENRANVLSDRSKSNDSINRPDMVSDRIGNNDSQLNMLSDRLGNDEHRSNMVSDRSESNDNWTDRVSDRLGNDENRHSNSKCKDPSQHILSDNRPTEHKDPLVVAVAGNIPSVSGTEEEHPENEDINEKKLGCEGVLRDLEASISCKLMHGKDWKIGLKPESEKNQCREQKKQHSSQSNNHSDLVSKEQVFEDNLKIRRAELSHRDFRKCTSEMAQSHSVPVAVDILGKVSPTTSSPSQKNLPGGSPDRASTTLSEIPRQDHKGAEKKMPEDKTDQLVSLQSSKRKHTPSEARSKDLTASPLKKGAKWFSKQPNRQLKDGVLVLLTQALTQPRYLTDLLAAVKDSKSSVYHWQLDVHARSICEIDDLRQSQVPGSEQEISLKACLRLLNSSHKHGDVRLVSKCTCRKQPVIDFNSSIVCARSRHPYPTKVIIITGPDKIEDGEQANETEDKPGVKVLPMDTVLAFLKASSSS